MIVAAAAALAVAPNHQDDVRRQRAAEVAAIRNEAEQLRQQAATIAQRGDAESTALAEQLRALAQELERSSNKTEALAALDEEIQRLQATLTPEALARKAAVRGLERSLASRAACRGSSASTSAAAQLAALADNVPSSIEERARLADRLNDLGRGASSGQPTGGCRAATSGEFAV